MAERLQRMKKEGKEHGKHKAEQEHTHRTGEPSVPRHMEAAGTDCNTFPLLFSVHPQGFPYGKINTLHIYPPMKMGVHIYLCYL